MHHLYRSKISFTVICLLFFIAANAQFESSSNLPEHDGKLYYFGIMLGGNSSYHKLTYTSEFRDPNTKIGSIESLPKGGFQLGLLANLQLSRHFDLRFYPLNLSFSRQALQIDSLNPVVISNKSEKIDVDAITMSFPLQVRFKSDRINNFRVYSLGGVRFDKILNSKTYNNNPLLQFRKSDFAVETGLGFQLFFPYFILSPELKFSYGLSNIHQNDANEKYSKLIDRMSNRMISFSLHFEGGILGRN